MFVALHSVLAHTHKKKCGLEEETHHCSNKTDPFRYGFLAVFASTDGGITRVFPNM